MAGPDLRRLFEDDPERFTKWYSSFRKRLVNFTMFRWSVRTIDAEEIVDTAFDICCSKPKNGVKHLERSWRRAIVFEALNRTRAHRKEIRREEMATARPAVTKAWFEGDDIADLQFNPELEVARSEAKANIVAHVTAVKEHLVRKLIEEKDFQEKKANKDALKILILKLELEGDTLKRREMIARLGMTAQAYDAAMKRFARAVVHPDVHRRTKHILLQGIVTAAADGDTPPPSKIGKTRRIVDSQRNSKNTIQAVDSAIREFSRLLFLRKRDE